MITISKPKLLAVAIILLVASASFYIGVHSVPAPTIARTVTAGDLGPCDYYIYLDGTTPVALFESHKGGTPGDNLVGTPNQDIATFLNPITTSGAEICLSGQAFNIGSTWLLQPSVVILGNFNTTVLQATANNFDLVGITHPACGGTPIRNMLINGLGFRANGHTGLTAMNFNQSLNEVSSNNIIQEIWVDGAFNYIAIMDGNEAAPLRDVYVGNSGSGDISYKVFNGASEIVNVQYMNPAGTGNRIHLLANQFLIDQSTIDSIQFETQFGGQNGGTCSTHITSGNIQISNTFIANNDPGGISRFTGATGQTNEVFVLTLSNDIIWSSSGGSIFKGGASGTSLTIDRLVIIGSSFTTGGGTGRWVDNTGGSGATLRMGEIHWINNFISGTFQNGNTMGNGFGNFFFQPEPVGFNGTCTAPCNGSFKPALPVGTGSANKVVNPFSWPVEIYLNITSSSGTVLQTGVHVIDRGGLDNALLGNPQTVIIYPWEYIYFVTNVPYAWKFYGLQW